MQRGGGFLRFEFPWASRLELTPVRAGLRVLVDLVDVEACGLSRWDVSKLTPSLPESLDVFEDALRDPDDCLWVEPFPDGAPAALCLTDHPDFDSVGKLRSLAELFGRLGLRFTKGVFPAQEPLGTKREPGLDVPEYRAVVDALFESGSEIALHGIGPRPRPPEISEFRRRLDLARPYSPVTWIDHGVGEYLFSRRARLPGGESLVELLGEAGIVNYWSYVDGWSNPFGDLRSNAERTDAGAILDFLRALGSVSGTAQGVKGLLYPLSHLANNLLGENGTLSVRGRPLRAASWRAAGASRRAHRAASARPTPIYGLDARGFALTRGDAWVFDTVLLSHPGVELSPAAVDRLRDASGLSLVHCYLSCTHPYIGEGCFSPGRDDALNPRFVADLEYIAERQCSGDLSVLPLRDLRSALERFRGVRLERVESGWRFGGESDGAGIVVGGSPEGLGRLQGEPMARSAGAGSRLPVDSVAGSVLAWR